MRYKVSVQTANFDVSRCLKWLRKDLGNVGAVVSFVGTVREFNDGQKISAIYLEHYSGMTEKALEKIVTRAGMQFDLLGAFVIHRVGALKPQDQIVLVACASSHRGQAFLACEFITDCLKTEAPLWKKEITEHGAQWVQARPSDNHAKARWE
ncbi:MAG: molybdenum cofactor biosynthesis protein MoaE [Limnobacter sp.]|nr:molybdenum cofactor biosynthesis protein MoaE [Limnobacter sp.]